MFKEMGRNMWSTGKGFAKVGALYSGIECCIEGVRLLLSLSSPPMRLSPTPMRRQEETVLTTQYRAKNDITNAVSGGFVTGAILARHSGTMAALGGGAAFAAFSGVIDWWLRSPPSECVSFLLPLLLDEGWI
jgi:import inner membrane translocase subunit TIM22